MKVQPCGRTQGQIELDDSWTVVSKTPMKGLGLQTREQIGLGQVG